MYKLADHVAIEINEEMNTNVLIDLEEGTLYRLNHTAIDLLQHIDSTGCISSYVEKVSLHSGLSHSQIAIDTNNYINELIRKGHLVYYDER